MSGNIEQTNRLEMDEKTSEMIDYIFGYFNRLPFRKRIKLAVKILRGAL